jgi:hypothetical protein
VISVGKKTFCSGAQKFPEQIAKAEKGTESDI